jgi:hypothetical protein
MFFRTTNTTDECAQCGEQLLMPEWSERVTFGSAKAVVTRLKLPFLTRPWWREVTVRDDSLLTSITDHFGGRICFSRHFGPGPRM